MAGQTIVISVLADTKKLAGGLDKAGGLLGNLGKIAGVAALATGAAIAAVGVGAFKAVAEIERLNAQTSAAIKSTGNAAGRSLEQIAAVADGMERMSGVEAEVIQGAQNMLLTFTQIKGDTFDGATQAALDMSVAMGTDMTSAATLVGKALNDPIKGIGALSKVGVQLTADQKALVAQMVETGDIAGAQGVILDVLGEQFGGSAEAFGNTFLGSVEKVKNSFGTLTEAFVTGLLPGATAALNGINDLFLRIADSPAFATITEGFNNFLLAVFSGEASLSSLDFSGLVDGVASGIGSAADWLANGGMQTIFDAITNAREGILTAALNTFPGILNALVMIAPQVVSAIAALLTQIVAFLATNSTQILGAAVTMLSGLIGAVAQILPPMLASLISVLPMIVTTLLAMIPQILESAIMLFTALVEAIPVILPPLIASIVEALPLLIEAILGMIPGILDGAITLFTALVEAIPVILPLLINALIDLVPKITTTVLNMLPKLLDSAVKLFTGIVTAVPKIIPKLIPAILNLLPKLVGAIIGMIPDLISAGVDLVGGLIKGLWQAAGSVGKALLDIAKNAIGGFLEFLGIHSPSRLFAGYGKNLVQGLVGGLDGNRGMFARSLDGLASMAADFSPEPLSISPAGALSADTVASAPTAATDVAGPAVVDLSASSARLLADLISAGLTVVLPGAALAGSVGAHNVVGGRRGAA